jgi:hypothetical protein
MTLAETITHLEAAVSGAGSTMYFHTEDRANEYQGGFPVALVPPPLSTLTWPAGITRLGVAKFLVMMVLMDLADPNSDRAEKEAILVAEWNRAVNIVRTLQDEFDGGDYPGVRVEDVEIELHMNIAGNTFHATGVALYFTLVTPTTFECL